MFTLGAQSQAIPTLHVIVILAKGIANIHVCKGNENFLLGRDGHSGAGNTVLKNATRVQMKPRKGTNDAKSDITLSVPRKCKKNVEKSKCLKDKTVSRDKGEFQRPPRTYLKDTEFSTR